MDVIIVHTDGASRIKKAYRRKALELHPDRNYGNVEAATKQFADVQSAYEVLSDAQERAWYDNHRDAFLRNEDEPSGEHYEHDVRVTTAEDLLKMFSNLNRQVDFSDSATGFYGVLRIAFNGLAREEEMACEWEGLRPVSYPSFGYADGDYGDVVRPFYAIWNGFATKKSFAWKDVYRYSDAPDRKVRRLMEKENKRFRDDGIREFNDAVRSLVAFVKKRDPRFKPNAQSEAERQKVLRDAAIAQAARSRAANQAKSVQQETIPQWMTARDPYEGEVSEDEAEQAKEEIECVVCRKSFKSERQYEAHEKSKKHMKAVQHLRRQMEQHGKDLNLDVNDPSAARDPSATDVANGGHLSVADPADVDEADDDGGIVQVEQLPMNGTGEQDEASTEYDVSSQAGPLEIIEDPKDRELSEPSSDDEYTARERVEDRILGGVVAASTSAQVQTEEPNAGDISETLTFASMNDSNGATSQPKLGKAKEKRAKKASQKPVSAAGPEAEFKCAACQARFPSKTRLFNHIKELGHAQPNPQPGKGLKGKKR